MHESLPGKCFPVLPQTEVANCLWSALSGGYGRKTLLVLGFLGRITTAAAPKGWTLCWRGLPGGACPQPAAPRWALLYNQSWSTAEVAHEGCFRQISPRSSTSPDLNLRNLSNGHSLQTSISSWTAFVPTNCWFAEESLDILWRKKVSPLVQDYHPVPQSFLALGAC